MHTSNSNIFHDALFVSVVFAASHSSKSAAAAVRNSEPVLSARFSRDEALVSSHASAPAAAAATVRQPGRLQPARRTIASTVGARTSAQKSMVDAGPDPPRCPLSGSARARSTYHDPPAGRPAGRGRQSRVCDIVDSIINATHGSRDVTSRCRDFMLRLCIKIITCGARGEPTVFQYTLGDSPSYMRCFVCWGLQCSDAVGWAAGRASGL